MNTSWKFYTNSEEAWEAMLLALEKAQKTIDLEQFIFYKDEIGEKFLNICEKKAKEGLKVRIFCDEVGSFPLYRSDAPKKLKEAGVEIKFFNSVLPWNAHRESIWYFRNHRKLLVIDEKIGFTGGACIGEEMRNWRESHVRIEGPIVNEMVSAFNIMWNKEYKKPLFYFQKKTIPNSPFSYITNSPLPRKRFMYYELIKAIKNAKHYIYLTTPYFLPDHKLLRTLKSASKKRGVKIHLLVPEKPNHFIVDIGSATFFETILKAKIKIFRYSSMIHSKTIVIDGVWSSIGSLNLDNISLRYNFEANIVSTDKTFTFELEKQFLHDLESTKELKLYEWQRRSIFQKILEVIVWPIRKLL